MSREYLIFILSKQMYEAILIIGIIIVAVLLIVLICGLICTAGTTLQPPGNLRLTIDLDQIIKLMWDRPGNALIGQNISYDFMYAINGADSNPFSGFTGQSVNIVANGQPLMITTQSYIISGYIIARSGSRSSHVLQFILNTPIRRCVSTGVTGSNNVYILTGGPHVDEVDYAQLQAGDICCGMTGMTGCQIFNTSQECATALMRVCYPHVY